MIVTTMVSANKKGKNIKIEMNSLKERVLNSINNHTGVNKNTLRNLSSADLEQVLSMILTHKHHSRDLMLVMNNISFIDEYLSEDRIRKLNIKNIFKNKATSRFGSASKEVYLMMKINAYISNKKALEFSFTPRFAKALLNVFVDKNLRQPELKHIHEDDCGYGNIHVELDRAH